MAEVSLACSKTGESGSSFRCDDHIVHVLGAWPLIGLGLLLATPPVVAALAMRKWVSWLAVAALVGLSIAGLANWSSFWGSLLFAVPLAALGLVAAAACGRASRQTCPSWGHADCVRRGQRGERLTADLTDTLRKSRGAGTHRQRRAANAAARTDRLG
jgi:hypothetical protein